jgi:hypothetical protein
MRFIAAHGPGIYLSPSISFSMGYARQSTSINSTLIDALRFLFVFVSPVCCCLNAFFAVRIAAVPLFSGTPKQCVALCEVLGVIRFSSSVAVF